MKRTAKHRLSMLLKMTFLATCLFALTSYNAFHRLWQPSQLEAFTEWAQINWQGQVVGWAKTSLTVDQHTIRAIQQEHFEGRVRGKRFKFFYDNTFHFDREPPYRLLRGQARTIEPGLSMTTDFVNQQNLSITQSRNGTSFQFEETALDYNLNHYLGLRQWVESQPVLGDSKTHTLIDPHSLELDEVEYVVTKQPDMRHPEYVFDKLTRHNSSPLSFSFDLSGRIAKQKRLRGIELVGVSAKPSFNPEMQQDLYASNGIPVTQPLGKVESADTITLSLSEGKLNWLQPHPSVEFKDNQLIATKGTRYPASQEQVSHWSFYESSPEVLKLSKKLALQPKQNTWPKVKALVSFVNDYLYYQPTPTTFTIDEVVNNGYGDCTEYTQLLLALLNEAKIPAREVSGYIYLGDDEQRFGGHQWVEVLVDGEWAGVDPTWNLTQVTAGHLPITISQEKSASDLVFTVEKIHYSQSLN